MTRDVPAWCRCRRRPAIEIIVRRHPDAVNRRLCPGQGLDLSTGQCVAKPPPKYVFLRIDDPWRHPIFNEGDNPIRRINGRRSKATHYEGALSFSCIVERQCLRFVARMDSHRRGRYALGSAAVADCSVPDRFSGNIAIFSRIAL